MRIITLFIGIFICISTGYSLNRGVKCDTTESIVLIDDFKISENEIIKLKKDALGGEPEAAFKLYQFYEIFNYDKKKAEYWARIAAENNNIKGQYSYAICLLSDKYSDMDSLEIDQRKQRAIFWLKKAANNNFELAREVLENIKTETQK